MSRLDMILVTASKASMCTKAEVDWTKVDSDHAGVQIWLDIWFVGFNFGQVQSLSLSLSWFIQIHSFILIQLSE